MKAARIAVAVFFVLSAPAFAQSEGVAEFQITMVGAAVQAKPMQSHGKVSMKKDAYRMDLEMNLRQAAAGRTDRSGGTMPDHFTMTMMQKLSEPDRLYSINDERRTYSVIDLKKLREDAAGMQHETYTVKKTGHDTVAGLSCEKALLTSSSGHEIELCVTRDLVSSSAWLTAMNRRDRSSGGFMTALRDNGLDGFPIRWITRRKGDKDATMTMELVRFEKKSVPSSLFEIPAGYRETSGMGVMMTPEQEKAMKDALEKMSPEQRKAYEEMMEKQKEK